ncbi:MAG: right-handed parallel beta-helix repeat-containing protein [bacterium]
MGKQSNTVLLLLVVAGGVSTAEAQVMCGDTITTREVLTEDLFCSGFDPALTIQGPGGRLDMRRFTVSCEGTTADGIELTGDGAVLQNGFVTSCGDGVRLQGTNGRVERMIVENNSDVGVFISDDAGSGNQVRETISLNNADDGFKDFSSGGNTFERNLATRNGFQGFQFGGNASGNTLRRNVSTNNNENGFEIDNDNHLVTQNVAQNNESDGFEIGASASDSWITLNVALKNLDDGIDVELGATNNALTRNVGSGNGSGKS